MPRFVDAGYLILGVSKIEETLSTNPSVTLRIGYDTRLIAIRPFLNILKENHYCPVNLKLYCYKLNKYNRL